MMDHLCPDCGLNVVFAYSKCEVTGKYHEGKPHVVQHVPIDGPVFTIADPDLDRLLNETHWESVGASQGIGSMESSITWLEALEKVEARLKVADNMVALYKYVGTLLQSDCDAETHWKVLRHMIKFFPQPEETSEPEREAIKPISRVVRSVREIEEGSFQYPVKVNVAYTLAGAVSNIALDKDELLRYVAVGLEASPIAEVSLIEGYHE